MKDWLTYTDEKGGYRIKYPPAWYFDNAQQENTVGGGITLFSYAVNPLAFFPKGTTPPPNLVKFEIAVVDTNEFSVPYKPTEPLAEWVARSDPLPSGTIVQEHPAKIGNQLGYIRISSFPNLWARNWVSIYIPRGSGTMMYIDYPQVESGTFEDQVIQTILANLEFLK